MKIGDHVQIRKQYRTARLAGKTGIVEDIQLKRDYSPRVKVRLDEAVESLDCYRVAVIQIAAKELIVIEEV